MKGEIFYDNMTPGVYLMKATPLVNQGEWFDVNSVEIQIDKRNTIFLPLSRGIKLNGSVLISRINIPMKKEVWICPESG